jgi:hypothetical protein
MSVAIADVRRDGPIIYFLSSISTKANFSLAESSRDTSYRTSVSVIAQPSQDGYLGPTSLGASTVYFYNSGIRILQAPITSTFSRGTR